MTQLGQRCVTYRAILAACACFLVSIAQAAEKTGFLGVFLDETETSRAVVQGTIPGQAAEKAGIKAGDVILEIGGKKTVSPVHLRSVVSETKAGDEVTVRILRENKEQSLKVKLGATSSSFTSPSGFGRGIFIREEQPTVEIKSLDASMVTLNLQTVKVSSILAEIEKQTGNIIEKSDYFSDMPLPVFQVEKKTFWETMDKLCEESGNVYGKEAYTGGG